MKPKLSDHFKSVSKFVNNITDFYHGPLTEYYEEIMEELSETNPELYTDM